MCVSCSGPEQTRPRVSVGHSSRSLTKRRHPPESAAFGLTVRRRQRPTRRVLRVLRVLPYGGIPGRRMAGATARAPRCRVMLVGGGTLELCQRGVSICPVTGPILGLPERIGLYPCPGGAWIPIGVPFCRHAVIAWFIVVMNGAEFGSNTAPASFGRPRSPNRRLHSCVGLRETRTETPGLPSLFGAPTAPSILYGLPTESACQDATGRQAIAVRANA